MKAIYTKGVEMSKTPIELRKNHQRICYLMLLASVVLATFGVLWSLRYTVLATQDSIAAFVFARKHSIHECFQQNLNYSYSRGKLTILFPLVTTFRDIVLKTGNYPAIWLLQYVPIYANVILIALILKKRVGATVSMLFALVFSVFLQVDPWYSLIICYPLDFMYGLFTAILGLYLFSLFLESKREGKNKSRTILLITFSAICFYASLATYEAFLMVSIVYAVLAFNDCIKGEKKSKNFVLSLIPHACVGVIYLLNSILLTRETNMGINSPTYQFFSGSVKDTLRTWIGYSTNMFPTRQYQLVKENTGFVSSAFASKARLLITIAGAFGSAIASILIFAKTKEKSEQDIKKQHRSLIVIGACGLCLGLFFSLPHALSHKYLRYYCEFGGRGFVITTICYFGWAVMLTCLLSIVLILIAKASNKKRIFTVITSAILCLIFILASLMTNVSNNYYWLSTTGGSIKNLTLRSYLMSEDYASVQYNLICTPDFSGIQGDIEKSETYFEFETGVNDIEMTNDYGYFLENLEDYERAILYTYSKEDRIAVIYPYTQREDGTLTIDSFILYSITEEDYICTYRTISGEEIVMPVSVDGQNAVCVQCPSPIDPFSIIAILC